MAEQQVLLPLEYPKLQEWEHCLLPVWVEQLEQESFLLLPLRGKTSVREVQLQTLRALQGKTSVQEVQLQALMALQEQMLMEEKNW